MQNIDLFKKYEGIESDLVTGIQNLTNFGPLAWKPVVFPAVFHSEKDLKAYETKESFRGCYLFLFKFLYHNGTEHSELIIWSEKDQEYLKITNSEVDDLFSDVRNQCSGIGLEDFMAEIGNEIFHLIDNQGKLAELAQRYRRQSFSI
jgi:hypothetical protein